MKDRRSYFRVEDNVIIDYKKIPNDKVSTYMERFNNNDVPYLETNNAFLDISNQINNIIHNNPQLENNSMFQVIELLDNKINILYRHSSEAPELLRKPTKNVNISASGIGFWDSEKFNRENKLLVQMLLLPKMTFIMAIAEIIYCNEHKDRSLYRVGCRFLKMHNIHKELLIQHTMHLNLKDIVAEKNIENRSNQI